MGNFLINQKSPNWLNLFRHKVYHVDYGVKGTPVSNIVFQKWKIEPVKLEKI